MKLRYSEAIKNFFKGHERTVKVKKNILASFAVKGISISISFLLVPLTINYVNPTQYGIWLTLSSIISWFAFFDIGFGNGLRNKLTEALSRKDHELARSYLSTAYALFFTVFGTVWIIFIIVNKYLNWAIMLNAPEDLDKELTWLAFIILSYFCLQFILKTINIVLTADQKPAKAAFIDVLGQAIALVVIFILTKTTKGSLINLGLGIGLSPVIILILASVWYYGKTYKNINPKIKNVSFDCVKDIMNLGVKFFILQVASMVIFQTNNIVIAHIFGPDEVTVYNVAYKYFSMVAMIFWIVITPFWSAFTDAYTQHDIDWMKNIIKKLEIIWSVIAVGGIILLLVSGQFFPFWVGDKIIIPFSVSISLLLYFLVYTRFNLYIILLNGIGKVKIQLLVYIPLAILNIPLIILLGMRFGLTGMILGNVLISVPHAIYGPIQLKRIIENRAENLWNM